jgi:type II secretory pathway pseudopilin PulG
MDMIKCKACGKDIAKNADRCPNCGCINTMDNASAAFTLIALGALVIIIGIIVVRCGNTFLFPIFFP